MNDFLTSKESTLKKFEKIEIHFDGIFQNRLATDPDSFDNPIGDLGWTRSHTGEPNFLLISDSVYCLFRHTSALTKIYYNNNSSCGIHHSIL
jgi:hypothetical protein